MEILQFLSSDTFRNIVIIGFFSIAGLVVIFNIPKIIKSFKRQRTVLAIEDMEKQIDNQKKEG